jgi:hypothetical protein
MARREPSGRRPSFRFARPAIDRSFTFFAVSGALRVSDSVWVGREIPEEPAHGRPGFIGPEAICCCVHCWNGIVCTMGTVTPGTFPEFATAADPHGTALGWGVGAACTGLAGRGGIEMFGCQG